MRRAVLTMLMLTMAATVSLAQVTPPRGYRVPTRLDLVDAWGTAQADSPPPYVAKADFDGDRREDEAWIFPAIQGSGWALFVYLAGAKGVHQAWQLAGDRTSPAQRHLVAVVGAGRYDTACAKGHYDCPHEEPERLDLTLPGIHFTESDRVSSIFWWDRRSRSFKRTWMTD